jgi:hypothetical protein
MASLDTRRPAAQEQLRVLGEQTGVATLPIIAGQTPIQIAKRANEAARLGGYDVILYDTAGRVTVDDELMDEVRDVKGQIGPHETLLVADALTPGRRLFLLSTGTGLAPFLSLARDPDIYERFNEIVVVHCVRQVSDLAFRDELESQLAGDPLVQDQALLQFHYLPTVTREPFRTMGRIDALIDNGALFGHPLTGPAAFDPESDRIMMCGSMAMIRELQARFEELGFKEGSNAAPGDFVIERAFVG